MKEYFDKNDFFDEVYKDNDEIRQCFKVKFKEDIDKFIDELYKLYTYYVDKTDKIPKDERKAHILIFIFNAINNLTISMNMLISGYLNTSGNVFRQFIESTLLSLLFSKNNLDRDYYTEFKNDNSRFKVSQVFQYIGRNINSFNMNSQSFEELKTIRKFYHLCSHSTFFSLSGVVSLSNSRLILGSNFDEDKCEAYKKEINMKISAVHSMYGLIDTVVENISNNYQ